MIYLDNAATTQIHPEVLEAMMPYLKEQYGNAGALYGLGRQSADAIATARKQVANLIGANPDQIIFTSGGTEANNLAILGSRRFLEKKGKKHIITSMTEHDSVLNAISALCNPLSCNEEKCIKDEFYTTFISVDKYGHISLEDLHKKISNYDDIGLVAVMCMNNEVGVLNPVVGVGALCKERDILFLTDCVQAAGNIGLDVNKIGCDFMSISSHKIHGPKGVGALYIRDRSVLSSLINGGDEQEFGLRGGTENVAGIVGFGKACELARCGLDERRDTVITYKERFCQILKDCLKCDNLENEMIINGLHPRYPGKTLSITFSGVDAQTLVLMLDSKGICISAGSACRSHEMKPSRTLLAMGLDEEAARSTVRISFSEFNEYHEIERAANIMALCVKGLRGITQ